MRDDMVKWDVPMRGMENSMLASKLFLPVFNHPPTELVVPPKFSFLISTRNCASFVSSYRNPSRSTDAGFSSREYQMRGFFCGHEVP